MAGNKPEEYIWERPGSGSAAVDHDGDGFPSLSIPSIVSGGFTKGAEPISHLIPNNHDGTFTNEMSRASSAYSGWAH
jgi:hypothetical protein